MKRKLYTANEFFKENFGEKVIKIALNAGFTCPNRDGTLSSEGCIFCSEKGSGYFEAGTTLSISEQFDKMKQNVAKKWPKGKYMVYFQSFSNTYAPIDVLREKYFEAINLEDVVAISIATRPDCINDDVLNLLAEISERLPLIVELGFQTSKPESIKLINRCYENSVFKTCVKKLKRINAHVISHVILGLPFETKQDMLETVNYVCNNNIDGIKLQLLHIIKGTPLEKLYYETNFPVLTFDEYIDIVLSAIDIIPDNVVIHRITGDAEKATLIEPKWSLDKRKVLNAINRHFLQN